MPLDLRCEIGGRGERGSEARQTRSVSAMSLPIANDRLILYLLFLLFDNQRTPASRRSSSQHRSDRSTPL